ncbi:MAG: 1-deoxy-D-xylulose-5-phosphate reductoisomerase, partial [Clostridia bacterium]|nr:1-deoxy-D-xylulose-5-phosphate reductoisomerase [Clostridia bacterium]
MKTIAILGSTGSIGTQALDICRRHPDRYRVTALTARGSKEKLFEQVREFRPEMAGLTEGFDPAEIPSDLKFCRFLSGNEALHAAAAEAEADMVLVSIVGIAGLQGVMDALQAGRQVLLANKEALVTGGHLVTDLARKAGKPLLPVDSEHSAIFQCLEAAMGNRPASVILTASGGPFRGYTLEQL